MSRVFIFGCSVTQHVWPTWADIVLHSARIKGYSVFNMGLSGSGNQHIKDSVIQADEKYQFTDKDLVLVMWSSWFREDRICKADIELHVNDDPQRIHETVGYWNRSGNVFNSRFYNSNFLENYADLDNYIINCITDIITIRKLYSLSWEGSLPIHGGEEPLAPLQPGYNTLADRAEHSFRKINMPNVFSDSRGTWRDKHKWTEWYENDGHPVPGEALQYVQVCVEKSLPFPIQAETLQWIAEWHERLIRERSQTDLASGEYREKFSDIMEAWYKSVDMGRNSDIWRPQEPLPPGTAYDPYGADTIQPHEIIDRFVRNHNADFPEHNQVFSNSPLVK